MKKLVMALIMGFMMASQGIQASSWWSWNEHGKSLSILFAGLGIGAGIGCIYGRSTAPKAAPGGGSMSFERGLQILITDFNKVV